MTPQNWSQLVLVLLVACLGFSVLAWSVRTRAVFAPAAAVLLGAAALVASLAPALSHGRLATTALVVVAGAVAVAGGGPLTARVFDVVDRGGWRADRVRQPEDDPDVERVDEDHTVVGAGSVLRGGAWIGALERLAVFAGLAAGFPEGVAVVLALKSVGRYPDLKQGGTGGAATERFIIGTFTSVLWGAACAGLVALGLR